jgi:putative endonuclease
MRVKDAVGRFGEDVAADRLRASGWEILARNWRPPRGGGAGVRGELDIVGLEGDTLVFVEVKTRSGDAYGYPAEAVRPEKVQRIRRLAALWLQANPDGPADGGHRRRAIRFDVVSIVRGPGPLAFHHVRGAF